MSHQALFLGRIGKTLTCKSVVFPLPKNPERRVTGNALTGTGFCFFAAADLTFATPFGFVEAFAFAIVFLQ